MPRDGRVEERRLHGFSWMLLLEIRPEVSAEATEALLHRLRSQVTLIGGGCTTKEWSSTEWLCVVTHPDGSLTNSEAFQLADWLKAQSEVANYKLGPQEDGWELSAFSAE
jgi:hypothetical protein